MGLYEQKLLEYMYSKDFVRTFHGKCPDCGKRIWSIGEHYDGEKHRIVAHFICNCGAEFNKTVFSKSKGYKYRYPQGIVEYLESTTKPCIKVIKQNNVIYKVTENGIKKRSLSSD